MNFAANNPYYTVILCCLHFLTCQPVLNPFNFLMKEQLHNGVIPWKVTDLSLESASLARGREGRARILLTGMDSSWPNTFREDGAFRLGEAAAGTGGRGVTLL